MNYLTPPGGQVECPANIMHGLHKFGKPTSAVLGTDWSWKNEIYWVELQTQILCVCRNWKYYIMLLKLSTVHILRWNHLFLWHCNLTIQNNKCPTIHSTSWFYEKIKIMQKRNIPISILLQLFANLKSGEWKELFYDIRLCQFLIFAFWFFVSRAI